MIGIYKITNLIDGNAYIGQSIQIEERFKEHSRYTYNLVKIDKDHWDVQVIQK